MKRILLALLFATLITTAPVEAAARLRFSGNAVSNTRPCQNSSITYTARVVTYTNRKPMQGATVTFKVKYKTTTTPYSAGKTNADGRVAKSFTIGRATPGYKVVINATAKKEGKVATATTSFTPKKCT